VSEPRATHLRTAWLTRPATSRAFDADVARAICAKLDVTCKFVVQAFDTLIPALDAKRFDIIISGLGITEERKKKIGYSIPYASAPQYFIVSQGIAPREVHFTASATHCAEGEIHWRRNRHDLLTIYREEHS
jgi:membrane-bound lytic murein transglycosylase MltF